MKKLPLLPHVCQQIGVFLFIPFLILGIAYLGWDYEISWLSYTAGHSGAFELNNHNFTDELVATGNIAALMLIAFSKEKTEDEAIQFFRLASLQWAVIANYVVLLVCILTVYGNGFLSIMIYNMFTILIIFIIRLRILLFRYNKESI